MCFAKISGVKSGFNSLKLITLDFTDFTPFDSNFSLLGVR